MANLFVLTTARITAPIAALKNANDLVALAVERFNAAAAVSGADVALVPEVEEIDLDAASVDLFGQVAAGDLAPADAMAALKALEASAATAAKAAKAEPAVLLLAGEPATGAEIKRAFRGQEDGTSVEIASLDGSMVGAITMFRV
jgi:hypothetical protein